MTPHDGPLSPRIARKRLAEIRHLKPAELVSRRHELAQEILHSISIYGDVNTRALMEVYRALERLV